MKRLIGLLLVTFALDASAIEIRFHWPETHGGPGSVIVDLSAPGLPAGCQFETDGNGVTNVAGDTNGRADSFRYDRTTGVTVRVSVATNGTQGTGGNTFDPPAISESERR